MPTPDLIKRIEDNERADLIDKLKISDDLDGSLEFYLFGEVIGCAYYTFDKDKEIISDIGFFPFSDCSQLIGEGIGYYSFYLFLDRIKGNEEITDYNIYLKVEDMSGCFQEMLTSQGISIGIEFLDIPFKDLYDVFYQYSKDRNFIS